MNNFTLPVLLKSREAFRGIVGLFRLGDWLVLALALLLLVMMFQQFWVLGPASKVKVMQAGKVLGVYSLQQERTLHVHGPLGETTVHIHQGKVRFAQSPCPNQYCVHQGWLERAGQVAICLPNQVSVELVGANKSYDSISY